jgi:hypothetical protein
MFVVLLCCIPAAQGENKMHIHKDTFKPDIEWERYQWTLPKSKARVEIVREIVMNNDDLEYMDLARPN